MGAPPDPQIATIPHRSKSAQGLELLTRKFEPFVEDRDLEQPSLVFPCDQGSGDRNPRLREVWKWGLDHHGSRHRGMWGHGWSPANVCIGSDLLLEYKLREVG